MSYFLKFATAVVKMANINADEYFFEYRVI